MVYYKYLFLNMEDLSPNEGIVYSELLFYSLTSNQEFKTGKLLYIDQTKKMLSDYKLMGWEETIYYYPLDEKTLMKRTEMSFPTVKKVLNNLHKKVISMMVIYHAHLLCCKKVI